MSFLNKTRPAGFNPTVLFFVSTFALLGVYLLVFAFRIRIEYFDTYTLYLGSRAFAGPDITEFFWWRRFIGLPLLLSPLFWLEKVFFAPPFASVACRLASVFIYLALVFIFFRWLLLFMPRKWAYWGAWLLSLNPLFIHYAPFVREDIPATFFTTLAFYFYWKSRAESRGVSFATHRGTNPSLGGQYALTHPFNYGATAVALSAAMATRYNLIPLMWSVVAGYEAVTREFRQGLRRKIFYYFILPLMLFVLVPSLAYGLRGLVPWEQAPVRWIGDFLKFGSRAFTVQTEPPLQNYEFLGKSMTWPLLGVALLGMFFSVKRRSEGTLFHILWFTVFFAFHTYAVNYKEARYLFPLFPALYFFAARGLEELDSFFKRSHLSRYLHPPVLSLTAMILLLLLPIRNAVRECLKFRDPIYTIDFAGEVSRYAKGLSQGHKIYWIGHFYALHPQEYLFHPEDEFTYLYHMYSHAIQYYVREPVTALTGDRENRHVEFDAVTTPSGRTWFVKANIVNNVDDGDVLILNLEEGDYFARTAPPDLKPLVVQRVRKLELELRATSPEGFLLYAAPQHPAARMVSGLSPQGFRIEGADLPFEGPCEIRPIIPGTLLAPERVEVSDGKFVFMNPALTQALPIPKIVLLCFDGVRAFDPEDAYDTMTQH